MSKQRLLRQLLRAAQVMVQGGLSETTRRCGNPGCICQRDATQRHGPHLYLTYRSEAKNRALYVPAKHAEEVRRAQAAWKGFGKGAGALARPNGKRWGNRWKGRGTRRGGGRAEGGPRRQQRAAGGGMVPG